MGSKTEFDAVAAELLWRMKATATKEFQAVQGEKSSSSKTCEHTITGVAHPATTTSLPYQTSHPPVLSNVVTMPRSRTISVGSSVDMPLPSNAFSSLVLMEPFLASKGVSPLSPHQGSVMLDHFDWTDRPSSHYHRVSTSSSSSSLISVSEVSSSSTDGAGLLPMKKDRVSSTVTPKVQSFVGQAANANSERGVLRKKFSWRQFPELEEYLQAHRDEYFEYSALNYTAEQRKYNNTLTRGLLKVAAEEGYIFQEFTFSMVRDRIRCYFKSHAQATKKKAKLCKK